MWATGNIDTLGRLGDGEIYSFIANGGKLYGAGYAAAGLSIYDPSKRVSFDSDGVNSGSIVVCPATFNPSCNQSIGRDIRPEAMIR
jgi:hypothetical protein